MSAEWTPWRHIGPSSRHGGIVLVGDHASNFVPRDIDLGVAPALLDDHIAIDIGVAGLAESMAQAHGIPAHLATVSRLVCDFNRDEDDPRVVPAASDGHPIPGNLEVRVEDRLARFHRPYHAAFAEWLDAVQPALVISLHSFTPSLKSAPARRPWEVGVLYNTDDSAARHGIRLFAERGLTVGDNAPYSGKDLNATMNRHAEARRIPYLGIEVRQDQIGTPAGQERYATLIADVAERVLVELG